MNCHTLNITNSLKKDLKIFTIFVPCVIYYYFCT